MGKQQILDINGKKAKEITTSVFDGQIRKDIVQKIAEVEKLDDKQLYAPFLWSGMQTSASGNVKHNRHVWKTDRGKGLSRYPKKRMSDKGERFVWVAAAIPGVRGGRRAHPPHLLRKDLKINKKEKALGLKSALAMVASDENIQDKYSRLEGGKISIKLPIIVESKMLSLKTKEFLESLRRILGDQLMSIAIQKRETRPGKGKMRGRKYKSNAGLLLVIANNQAKKINGIDVVNVKGLKIGDLASNGARLVMFTEESIKDLETKITGGKK